VLYGRGDAAPLPRTTRGKISLDDGASPSYAIKAVLRIGWMADECIHTIGLHEKLDYMTLRIEIASLIQTNEETIATQRRVRCDNSPQVIRRPLTNTYS